jgi:CDP-paratose 2-epimerase
MTQDHCRFLITGGAGFIGTNLAARLIGEGHEVVVLDSLARPGSDANIRWLRETFAERVEFMGADVRDRAAVERALRDVDHVVHLAAQVAVTTSLMDPLADFDVNARGTLTLLEAIRTSSKRPSLLFTSTNKVYGGLDDIELEQRGTRYVPADPGAREQGVSECRSLDFHSPYGCSKGAADQYVLDYARSFGLRTVVLRMSCIYGPHQNGNEDQGWVAHFVRHALTDGAVTIYGDGKQVRDVLFVDDLLNAFELARKHIDALSGRAFNIGGGAQNTLSLLELIEHLEEFAGDPLDVQFSQWRVGDQRYYVSDIARFRAATGWQPATKPELGLLALREWLEASTVSNRPAMRAVAEVATMGARP